MSIETLPFEHRPRNSIANNLDKINELVDWVNLDTHLYASASGERVTVDVASNLKGLTVDGRSVQDGTPTPDAPVPVQVVSGRNLLPNISSTNRTHNGVTFSINENRIAASGTSSAMAESNLITLDTPVTLEAGKQYTISLSGEYSVSGSSTLLVFYDESSTAVFNSGSQSNGVWTFTPSATMNLKYMRFRVNTAGATVNVDANIQLEAGSTATPYIPYGSIGININGEITPIDLQGNVLASLPDGTKDVLTVNSAGHCVLEKRVDKTVFDGSESWRITNSGESSYYYNVTGLSTGTDSESLDKMYNKYPSATIGTTGATATNQGAWLFPTGIRIRWGSEQAIGDLTQSLADNPLIAYYKLETPQTIDLGYIDMPTIPSGSVVTVSASLTPTFTLEWWVDDGITALVDDLIAYVDYKTEG